MKTLIALIALLSVHSSSEALAKDCLIRKEAAGQYFVNGRFFSTHGDANDYANECAGYGTVAEQKKARLAFCKATGQTGPCDNN